MNVQNTENKIEPAVYRAKEAAAYLGVGLTKFYALIKTGKLNQGIRFSCRCRVWRKKVLDEFIDALEKEQNKE